MRYGQLHLVHDQSSINEEKNLIDEKGKAPSTAPLYQDEVFIIMFPSNKSGGTYTELRKSEAGKNKLLQTLEFYGYDMSKVKTIKQKKPWVPIKGEKKNKTKGKRGKKK